MLLGPKNLLARFGVLLYLRLLKSDMFKKRNLLPEKTIMGETDFKLAVILVCFFQFDHPARIDQFNFSLQTVSIGMRTTCYDELFKFLSYGMRRHSD